MSATKHQDVSAVERIFAVHISGHVLHDLGSKVSSHDDGQILRLNSDELFLTNLPKLSAAINVPALIVKLRASKLKLICPI